MTQQLTRPAPRKTAGGRPKVQSVDRTLDVLEALASRRGATGISELSQLVGLHVSTVHRLLATLVDRGYVRQDPESSRYHLGSRVFTLSSAADVHLDLRLVARPYLERLMRNSGETANLVTMSDGEVVYLDQVASMHLVKMFTSPGMRAPLYCTGSGKAMLAFGPAANVERVLSVPLARRTPKTLAGRSALESELATHSRTRTCHRRRRDGRRRALHRRPDLRPPRRRRGCDLGFGTDDSPDARARRAALAGRPGARCGAIGPARLRTLRSPIVQRFTE